MLHGWKTGPIELVYVRWLTDCDAHGRDLRGDRLLRAFEYHQRDARPKHGEARYGAALKYAGKPWYAFVPAASARQLAPIFPSPIFWTPPPRQSGEDEAELFYLNEDSFSNI